MVGLIPAEFQPPLLNLASPGGTPIEMYFLAKRFLATGHPAAALISFSAMQFAHDPSFWDSTVRLNLLSPSELDEVYAVARAQGDREIIGIYAAYLPINRLKKFLLPRRFPPLLMATIRNSGFGARGAENRRLYAEMIERKATFRHRRKPGRPRNAMPA